MPAQAPHPPAHPPLPQGSPLEPTPAHSPVLGVGTLDVLALLEVGLQVHLQEGWAVRVVGAPHGPVVAAALVVPGRDKTRNRLSPQRQRFLAPDWWRAGGSGEHLLSGTELNGEGATSGVHLKDSGLPDPCCPTAVPAVDGELPNLLGHGNVVHHHRQLGVVHGALL